MGWYGTYRTGTVPTVPVPVPNLVEAFDPLVYEGDLDAIVAEQKGGKSLLGDGLEEVGLDELTPARVNGPVDGRTQGKITSVRLTCDQEEKQIMYGTVRT